MTTTRGAAQAAPPGSIGSAEPPSSATATPPCGWSDLAPTGALATERLEAELVSHAAWEAAGLARMLDLLAEYDERDGWSRWIGCRSMQQWLSWHCGLGYTAATERLRVARALPGLPAIRSAFRDGVLSWSKVRELSRVATAADDSAWAELAGKTTAAQLSRLVRQQRRITADDVVAQEQRREATRRIADDGSMVIELRLPADEGAVVWSAIDEAAGPPQREVPAGQRRADAAVGLLLAQAEIRTEVQVHIEECPTCRRRAASADGAPLHPDVADVLACDADVVTTHDHTRPHDCDVDGDAAEVGEIDRRRGPSRRQRRALRYRHAMCQFPGCHHDGRFDAHHVIAHGAGGRTRVRNLVRLCRFHHRLVHLARLVLSLGPDRELTVTTPDGRPIDPGVVAAVWRIREPDDLTRISGLGERMDIDACLFAVRTASSIRRTDAPPVFPRETTSPATASTAPRPDRAGGDAGA